MAMSAEELNKLLESWRVEAAQIKTTHEEQMEKMRDEYDNKLRQMIEQYE